MVAVVQDTSVVLRIGCSDWWKRLSAWRCCPIGKPFQEIMNMGNLCPFHSVRGCFSEVHSQIRDPFKMLDSCSDLFEYFFPKPNAEKRACDLCEIVSYHSFRMGPETLSVPMMSGSAFCRRLRLCFPSKSSRASPISGTLTGAVQKGRKRTPIVCAWKHSVRAQQDVLKETLPRLLRAIYYDYARVSLRSHLAA